MKLKELSKKEQKNISGGWNLVEYFVMYTGYLVAKGDKTSSATTGAYTNGSYIYY